MSDVGLSFSGPEIFAIATIIALPLTTILLVILVWRRIAGRGPRRALNAGIFVLGLLWVLPVGLFVVIWVDGLIEEMRAAQRHFTLTAERRIDGIVLPAGSEVMLDGYDRLESATLPAGAELTLDGVAWRGFVKFVSSIDKDAAEPARISFGQPASDANFDRVPCRGGQAVAFWGLGGLHSCTLASDFPAQADIADAKGEAKTARFLCAADRVVEFQPGGDKQVSTCTLAALAEVQSVPCAAGAQIEIIGAGLSSCTLAEARPFDGIEIPAGSALHLIGTPRRIERFLLPAMAMPITAFGIKLPSNTEVWLCEKDRAVDQLIVPYDAFVEIGGVKLTGTLNFDCGVFRLGSLFEDSQINGETWMRGRTVLRENVDLPTDTRP
jgi:hypothetical protein